MVQPRGGFTVAKKPNVRLRSGWTRTRSPNSLRASRPVTWQEAGFSNILPTDHGLFASSTMEDIVQAVESISAAYEHQCRTARALAKEYFSYDIALKRLLMDVGL